MNEIYERIDWMVIFLFCLITSLLTEIMFGASASFATPMGYQTNAMVFGPGGYRFADSLRVGGPLDLLLAVVASLLIPRMWS